MKPKQLFLTIFNLFLFYSLLTIQTPASTTLTMEETWTDESEETINDLFEQMATNHTNNMLNATSNTQQSRIEKELSKQGVQKMTASQINNFIKGNNFHPNSNISFWYKDSTYKYKGKKYFIRKLYAKSCGDNNRLDDGADGCALYTNMSYLMKNTKYLASIYTQKALGLIPVIQWTPYELLFADVSNVTNESHKVTYRSTQTYCWVYVEPYNAKKKGQNLQLCFSTNMVTVSYSQVFAGYKTETRTVKKKKVPYRVPYTKAISSRNFTSKATSYGSTKKAVMYYLGESTQRTSYVEQYRFLGPSGSNKKHTQKLALFDSPNLLK